MITEKMYTEKTYKEFYSRGFPMGRMISQSKSGYRDRHPQHDVMFNANIIIEGANKAWFGDLDITIDRPLLEEIAKALDKDLYILKEMDARFGAENESIKKLKSLAEFIIKK